MRVVVNRALCESNAVCVATAPEVFEVDDDTDRLRLLQEEPPPELRPAVATAVRKCPKGALSLED